MRSSLSWLVALAISATALTADAQTTPPTTDAASAETAPQVFDPVLMRSGESVEVSESTSEMAVISGGVVRISAQVEDDIFAAGGELAVEGASADHLILAGGEIEIAPANVQDIIAAGGRIELRSGTVVDDVVIAGGDIRLSVDARVDGAALLTGGRIRVNAAIGRDLYMGGGRVVLDAAVGGDARVSGGQVVIGPNTRIAGDLHVRGESIEISPQAIVQGEVHRQVVLDERGEVVREGAIFAGVVFALMFALGFFVLHGVLAAGLPGMMAGANQCVRTAFWQSAGVGALIVLLGPICFGLLLATLIGIPLALVLLLAYLLAMVLAFTVVAYWLGQLVRDRLARTAAAVPPKWGARFGWTALGVLLTALVYAVPILGQLAWLVTLVVGIGALTQHLFTRPRTAESLAPP